MEKDKMIEKRNENNEPKNGEIFPLFPIPLVKTNIGLDFTDEINFFQNIPIYREGKNMVNHRSKDYYLFDKFAEELKYIKSFCEYHLKLYLEEIEGVDTNLAGLRITQSWLNITKPGEYHNIHSHPNSYLSGVLYISCLPDDSIIIENRSFGNYNNMRFQIKKGTEWNNQGMVVKVTEGDLIIFPSWVPHSVDQNETKNMKRISLAFNTFPIGEMGVYNFATQLKL